MKNFKDYEDQNEKMWCICFIGEENKRKLNNFRIKDVLEKDRGGTKT